MKYYINSGGEIQGPLGEELVRQRIQERAYGNDDLVREEDHEEWTSLSSSDVFKGAFQQAPAGNPLAIISLVCALASMPLLVLFPAGMAGHHGELGIVALMFWVLALTAMVTGQIARRKVNRSTGRTGGYSWACMGLVLGWFTGILSPIAVNLPGRGGHQIQERGNLTKGISNCRQIITTLRIYASDNNGKYPDAARPNARSSNEVFREMFVGGQADNEMIFGCPASQMGVPDGNIGMAPDYKEALGPKENHWAMTRGLNEKSDGSIPVVYENPAEATWPPKWNADAVGKGTAGRSWSGGRIIIGLNDSSVSLMKLESARGESVGLQLRADGKPVFATVPFPVSVLNAER